MVEVDRMAQRLPKVQILILSMNFEKSGIAYLIHLIWFCFLGKVVKYVMMITVLIIRQVPKTTAVLTGIVAFDVTSSFYFDPYYIRHFVSAWFMGCIAASHQGVTASYWGRSHTIHLYSQCYTVSKWSLNSYYTRVWNMFVEFVGKHN